MPAKKYSVVVDEVTALTPTVTWIKLRFLDGASFDFAPGQFVTVYLEREGRRISRPYSIASTPTDKDSIGLCVKRVEGGTFSSYLCAASVGERLTILGPAGSFVLREPPAPSVYFVATGTGVAPFLSMIDYLLGKGWEKEIILILGVRYISEIILRGKYERMAAEHPGFRFIPTLSRPERPDWQGEVGYVQRALDRCAGPGGGAGREIYICGLRPMVEEVRMLAELLGFHTGKIYFEKYD